MSLYLVMGVNKTCTRHTPAYWNTWTLSKLLTCCEIFFSWLGSDVSFTIMNDSTVWVPPSTTIEVLPTTFMERKCCYIASTSPRPHLRIFPSTLNSSGPHLSRVSFQVTSFVIGWVRSRDTLHGPYWSSFCWRSNRAMTLVHLFFLSLLWTREIWILLMEEKK